MQVNIKISIKAHGDVDGQVKGRLTGSRSLKFSYLVNQEISHSYAFM